jgi:hypothetical protein
VKNEVNSRILKSVPREKAFYFFTSIGNYTGESAASLKEFMDKISSVNVKSLEFHLYRGDFEKWMIDVLEDKELALEVRKLQRFNLAGEPLRSQLHLIISKQFRRLTSQFSPTQI